jgi:hypothetical protein
MGSIFHAYRSAMPYRLRKRRIPVEWWFAMTVVALVMVALVGMILSLR